MRRQPTGRTILWGVLLAIGGGAWLLGAVAFGLTTSHSGLATPGHWIANGGIFMGGAALAFLSGARLAPAFGEGRRAATSRVVLWAFLALPGVAWSLLALLTFSSDPEASGTWLAVTIPMAVVPAVAFARELARRRRAPEAPARTSRG